MIDRLINLCEEQKRAIEINVFSGHSSITVSCPAEPFLNDYSECGFRSVNEIADSILFDIALREESKC